MIDIFEKIIMILLMRNTQLSNYFLITKITLFLVFFLFISYVPAIREKA